MIKKVIDIAVVFVFIAAFAVGSAYGQAVLGTGDDDRALAPNRGKAATAINVPGYTYI